MGIDYSQFIEPEPSPAPAPPPSGGIDYSQFIEPEPSPAPAPGREVFERMAGGMPKPSAGKRFIDALRPPVNEAPLPGAQYGQVVESSDLYDQERLAHQAARVKALAPYRAPGGGVSSDSGPLPADVAAVNYDFPSYEAWRTGRSIQAGLDPREARGFGGSVAAGLSQGFERLGSMVARGQLAPDPGLEARYAQDAGQFRAPTFGEQVGAGLGGSVPALLAVAATRGRTLPGATGSMAVPLEVGGASFAQGLADPGKSPTRNLQSALIEALFTRAGGAFEPGFATPGAQLPAQIGKEGIEEAATAGAQNLGDQTAQPGFDGQIDWSQFIEQSAVGGAAGSLAAGGMAPLALASQRGAEALQPAPVEAPRGPSRRLIHPEDVTKTQTDLRPVDVQNLEAELARNEGIPSWVDDETRAEIVARFRPDERYQIPSLNTPDFQDADHLARLQAGVRSYLDRANSEADKDLFNATVSTLDAVPNAVAQKAPRITGRPTYAEPPIQDDPSIVASGNAPDNVVPEPDFSTTLGEVGIARPGDRKTGNIAPEFAAPDAQQGRVSIPVRPEDSGIQQQGRVSIPVRPEDSGIQQQGRIVTPAKAEVPPSGRTPDQGKGVYDSLVAQIPADELASPVNRKGTTLAEALKQFDPRKDPDGVEGNINQLRMNASDLRKRAAKTAPAAPAVQAPAPQAPAVRVPASTASKFPAPRGAVKGAKLVDDFFGPKPAKPSGQSVPGSALRQVRVFKDAGTHGMQVKMAGQYGVALDPVRGKTLIVTRTDAKGRADPEGQELRPVDAEGQPGTVSDQQEVPVFGTPEDAARFIGRNFTASKPAAEPVGFGVQDAAIRATPDQADERMRVLQAKNPADLTDAEMDELQALEDAEREAETPPAKPAGTSPLTPKTRAEVADSVDRDTPPESAAKIVQNLLDAQLRRDASFAEIRAALADLEAEGIITPEQAKARLERSRNFNASFFPGLAQAIPDIKEYVQAKMDDLSDAAQLNVQQMPALSKGSYGSTARQIARAVTRALGITGPAGKSIADWAMRLNHLLGARVIAARFPAFGPILSLAQQQVSNTRLAFGRAYERLNGLSQLDGEERLRVSGALIQFRLEDRAQQDFTKPVTYTDERGRKHTYTLTAEQVQTVKDVYAANKSLLTAYVRTLASVLQLPANSTAASVKQGIASGAVPEHAKAILGPLEILESGAENYVPLKRFGDFMKATVYDPVTGKMVRFIKAESLADYRKQIDDALSAHPGAAIKAVEELDAEEATSGVTPAQLAALADAAGLPPAALQDFLDAGVGSYLATRGIGARFAQARNVEGFSHDMLRANSHHAKQMTETIMRLAHHAAMQKALKTLKGDKLLHEYAQRFIARMDTPIPPVASAIRSVTTLFYLGFAPVSAMINATSSMVFAPAMTLFATGNPMQAAKVFSEAAKQQGVALAYILGAGPVIRKLGRGDSHAEITARMYDKSEPKLAKAIRQAEKAGTFADSYNREAESVAATGGTGSQAKERIGKAMMHFFSTVETANRLTTFVAGYRMYEQSAKAPRFAKVVADLGFRGGHPYQFAEWFSDFNNFRMDKTDMPSWAQGGFKKDASGKEVFTPSTWRPAAYALKSWSVNYLQQQALILRAALKGGWIDKALYGAIAAGFIATFGAVNMIPGMQSVDEVAKVFSKDLEKPSEQLAQTGPLGRTLATGLPGAIAAEFGANNASKYLDQLAARTGPGNVIPSNLDSLLAPLGVATAVAGSLEKIASGDRPRQLEGVAGLLGKQAGKAAEAYNMATGSRGKTSKTGNTIVPADQMDAGSIAAYASGLQPPVLETAYRMRKMAEDMRTSNDRTYGLIINTFADGVLDKDESKRKEALEIMRKWNKDAMDAGQVYKIITPDSFQQGVMLEIQQRKLGAKNLRGIPLTGRGRYLQELRERSTDEDAAEPE